jgi:hypothetical protein
MRLVPDDRAEVDEAAASIDTMVILGRDSCNPHDLIETFS